MTEILYELREYSAGLNASRWDYIFSLHQELRRRPGRVMPDRTTITYDGAVHAGVHRTAGQDLHHERGAHAIGGMAAFVPSGADPEATAVALERTRADKAREGDDGFDGSWVARPGLDAHLHQPRCSLRSWEIGRTKSSADATMWRSPPGN